MTDDKNKELTEEELEKASGGLTKPIGGPIEDEERRPRPGAEDDDGPSSGGTHGVNPH